MSRLLNILPILGIILFLSGCESNTIYHSYLPIQGQEWHKNDSAVFRIGIPTEHPTRLRLYVDLRVTRQYPYQELYLTVTHNLQDTLFLQTDTLMIAITNAKGHYKGKGWESLYQYELPCGVYTCANEGQRTIKTAHCMSDETLKGVYNIGIRLARE